MVGKDLPNGQTKVGDKVVNDVKLTNLPAGRFDGQLRPYSQADVERLRYAIMLMVLLMATSFSAQTAQILNPPVILAGVLSKLNILWLRMVLASCGSSCTVSHTSTPWVP